MKASFLFVPLFALVAATVIVHFTTKYASLWSRKSDICIAVSNFVFLLTISSTFSKFHQVQGYIFFTDAATSDVLWTTFSAAVFAASIPVFAAVFNFFLYLSDRYLANDKNPYHLTYFLVLGSIECGISI